MDMDFTKCFDKLEQLSINNFWKRPLSAPRDYSRPKFANPIRPHICLPDTCDY